MAGPVRGTADALAGYSMPSLVQWKWYMRRPPVFLAVGSFLLFFGPQLIPMWGNMASAAGGILLFIGWIDLGWALFHQGNFRRAPHGFIMVCALLVSAVGFGLGLITLPMAFPQGEYLLFTWTFHYAPTVYAPVVVSLAIT